MTELVPVDTCQISGLQHMLYAAFGDRKDGFFVEVGAYDGITYSNTYHLARGGWSGIYIEPIDELYAQCVGNHIYHMGVRVIHGLVGEVQPYPEEIYTDGVELYTTRQWFAEELTATGKTAHFKTMAPKSLDFYLEAYKVEKHFELLVIDVEGAELDVLNGFSLYYWFPQMAIVETHELHTNEKLRKNAQLINDMFTMALYTKIYTDRWNSVYVR